MKPNSFFHSSSNVWAPKRVLAGDGSLVADSSVGMCLMKDSETLGVKLKSKNIEILGFKYVLMIMTITFKEKKIKKKKWYWGGFAAKATRTLFFVLKITKPIS